MWPSNKGKQKNQKEKKTLNIFFAYVIQVKYVYKAAISFEKGNRKRQKKFPRLIYEILC